MLTFYYLLGLLVAFAGGFLTAPLWYWYVDHKARQRQEREG